MAKPHKTQPNITAPIKDKYEDLITKANRLNDQIAYEWEKNHVEIIDCCLE